MKIRVNRAALLLISIVFALFAAGSAAFAAAAEYNIEELKMNISIDGDMSVITRDAAPDDPVFEELGVSRENIMQSFESSGIYLQGISPDGGYMLTVNMTSDESSQTVVSYGKLSDDERLALKDSFLGNDIYTDGSVASINGNYFIVLSFKEEQEEHTVYGIQYNTVENGQNINITLQTSVAELDAASLALIEDAVNSIEFTEKAEAVSMFRPILAAVIIFIAVILIAAALILLRRFTGSKRARAGAAGGFDNREKQFFYKRRAQKLEKRRLEEEKKRLETRRRIVENIDSGENYDVFKD